MNIIFVAGFLAVALTHCCLAHGRELFTEEVLLERLGPHEVLAHFHFKQSTTAMSHPQLFPPAVLQLAEAVPFAEVELHMTHGRWLYDRWGLPLVPVKPGGAELKATFHPQLPPAQRSSRWSDLTHALSGLFCASLHLLAVPESVTAHAPAKPQLRAAPTVGLPPVNTAADAASSLAASSKDAAGHVRYEGLAPGECPAVAAAAALQESVDTPDGNSYPKACVAGHRDGSSGSSGSDPILSGSSGSSSSDSSQSGSGSGSSSSSSGSSSSSCSDSSSSSSSSADSPPSGSGSGSSSSSSSGSSHPSQLLAWLPKEAVCAENLTPWLKLLPCRDQAGLAQLLGDRAKLYSTRYHSMSVTITARDITRHNSTSGRLLQLAQTLTLVLTLPKQQQQQHSPHKADGGKLDLAGVLGARLSRSCPAAALSRVYVVGGSSSSRKSSRGSLEGETTGGLGGDEGNQLGHGYLLSGSCTSTTNNTTNNRTAAIPDCTARRLGISVHDALLLHADTISSLPLPAADPMEAARLLQCRLPAPAAAAAAAAAAHQNSQKSSRVRATAQQDAAKSADARSHGVEAAARPCPSWRLQRYLTGSGTHLGGMVLELQRWSSSSSSSSAAAPASTAGATPAAAAAAAVAAAAAMAAAVPEEVCVFQLLPWHVRVWLHTLELRFDGKVVPLQQHALFRHVQAARDRQAPGVLDLCLSLPVSVQSASLAVAFTKAFMTVSEQPPDAHRGVDIPAAIVTYLEPRAHVEAAAAVVAAPSAAAGGADASFPSWGLSWLAWGVATAEANAAAAAAAGPFPSGPGQPALPTPLLHLLSQARPEKVYSEGLLVQMATPDISMPYNVICLTSTVLAVFVGAMLNSLIKRPSSSSNAAEEAEAAEQLLGRRRRRKLVGAGLLLLVGLGAAAVCVDPGTAAAAKAMLGALS